MRNDGEPTIAETPNEEIMEQSNLQTKTNDEQAEIEQGANTLPSENELDRNKENIQYKEIDAEGVKKTQVIKEAEELLAENEESLKEGPNNKINNTDRKDAETNKKLNQMNEEMKKNYKKSVEALSKVVGDDCKRSGETIKRYCEETKESVKTVSYTHLDVYKRQNQYNTSKERVP